MTDYNDKTKKELLEIARERDLEGRTGFDKEELVAALEALDSSEEVEDIEVVESEVETQENGSESVIEGVWEDTEPTVNDLAGVPEDWDGVDVEEDEPEKEDWLENMQAYLKLINSQT